MPNRQEEFLIHSLEDLQVFADKLALELQGGEVIALQGELGAGKTTLVKFLAAALGVNQEVSSPTFALERQYATNQAFKLHHFDWYRLDTAKAVKDLGVQELFGQPNAVCVIEWPQRGVKLLPSDTMWIYIDYVDTQTRKITFHRRS